MRINEGVFNTILFEAHCAAFDAIDDVINSNLNYHEEDKVWIKDKHLPDLIPALDRAIRAALSEVYEID